MRLSKRSESALFWILLPWMALNAVSASAQSRPDGLNTIRYQTNDGKVVHAELSADEITAQIVNNLGVMATSTLDLNEPLNVIVELKSPAILQAQTTGQEGAAARMTILPEHDRLKADIATLQNRLSKSTSGNSAPGTTIRREFTRTFNGVALRSSRRMVEAIKALPYVKKVHPDFKVQPLLSESVPLIRAPDVWQTFGVMGDGMLIGILDTGVDYTHPDLGGGYGPQAKVVGGYDFVNNDPDPMDDHGHGTLVAGVLAAEGETLQGVAPHAKLMSFKVVDASGSGISSDMIAALEMASDPDGDPGTNDRVDVINISLGGFGHPDDPVSQAVDNIVAAGIVCVIAAGNDHDFFSIRSPGTARKAITVGASSKNDGLASFTSKGPNPSSFEIKPELVAPGISINTTKSNGGYNAVSGTSMAAPHVAGAAALLLQLHPDWTPEIIKAVLMQRSVNLNKHLFEQGSGRLDVFEAATPKSAITPPQLSLGLVDSRQEIWTATRTLKLHNLSSAKQTYVLSPKNQFDSGISITLTPNAITVAPGEIASIEFELSVETKSVAMVTKEPYAYVGAIQAVSESDTLSVPVAFLKSPRLHITFDEIPWFVVIHNRKNDVRTYIWPGNLLSDLLPEDTYDILIFYPDNKTQVIREGLSLSTLQNITVNKTEAMYHVDITPLDEAGGPVVPNDGVHLIKHQDSNVEIRLNGPMTERSFSSMSTSYVYEWTLATKTSPRKFYQFSGYSEGISESLQFQNSPDDLKHVTYHYNAAPDVDKLFVLHWISAGPAQRSSSTFWNVNDAPLGRPFVEEGYYMPKPYGGFSFGNHFKTIYHYKQPPFDASAASVNKMYETPNLEIKPDGSISGFLFDENAVSVFQTKNTLEVALNPPFWFGKFVNSTSNIKLKAALGTRLWLFLKQLGDMPLQDQYTYELWQEEELLTSGQIRNIGAFDSEISIPITPGIYTFKIAYDEYSIGDLPGQALIQATFNTLALDKNPPTLSSLHILSDDAFQDHFSHGKDIKFQFTLSDDFGIGRVEFFYKTVKDSAWKSLLMTNNDSLYEADLIASIDQGALSLKIVAEDLQGNLLQYSMEPALRISNQLPGPFSLVQPANQDTVETPKPVFDWENTSDPDNRGMTYSMYYSTEPTFPEGAGTTKATGLSQSSFIPSDSLRDNQTYYWKVAAIDADAGWRWSNRQDWRFWLNYVNDAPRVHLPDTSFANDTTLTISLSAFVNDPDNRASELHWSASCPEDLIITINDTTKMATFSATNFVGSVSAIFKAEDPGGLSDSDTMLVIVRLSTLVPDFSGGSVPDAYQLYPNYPNPFNSETTIQFDLPRDAEVSLTVYNLLGEKVRQLTARKALAGHYRLTWNGRDQADRPVASGVYLVTLRSGHFVQSRKILLLK